MEYRVYPCLCWQPWLKDPSRAMGCAASTAMEHPKASTPLKGQLPHLLEAPEKEKKTIGWVHSLFEGSAGTFVQPSFGCTVSGT